MVIGKINSHILSISETVSKYNGNRPSLNLYSDPISHVQCWVNQFKFNDYLEKELFLDEFSHVLSKTFITKEIIIQFLQNIIHDQNLIKNNHSFWTEHNFLNIQLRGRSQQEMISIFNQIQPICHPQNNPAGYIYLDDIIFTGKRVYDDLSDWIKNNDIKNTSIHIIVMGVYKGSYYYTNQLSKSFPSIDFKIWRYKTFENRSKYSAISEILWPTKHLTEDTTVQLRSTLPHQSSIFKSESGRQVLEEKFTLAGIKIIEKCSNINSFIKPLGNSTFQYGFGSLIVTYRNCPNNTPLALWWGDPSSIGNSAMEWYPLFPRITYN